MLIFDFDGTLINLWPRYYSAFCELTNCTHITLEEYISVKKRLVKDQLVADAFGVSLCQDYFSKKKILLEDRQLLALDTLYFPCETINNWSSKEETLILSKRRFPENLRWELERLQIELPSRVISSASKKDWLSQYMGDTHCTLFGDSLSDLETGLLPNVKVCMVGYGLGNKEQFDKLGIDYLYLASADGVDEYLRV